MWEDQSSLTLRVSRGFRVLKVFDANAFGEYLEVNFSRDVLRHNCVTLECRPYRPDCMMVLCEISQ